jgi:hypothetical protein
MQNEINFDYSPCICWVLADEPEGKNYCYCKKDEPGTKTKIQQTSERNEPPKPTGKD